jgi:hypothetical protein
LKPKNFSAAIFLAAFISGFAVNVFACGPDFPNNLLDAGDNAVLQPPVADFQRELARMKLIYSSAAVPLRSGQSFSEQSAEIEMADLASALKQEKISDADAVKIISAHRAEREKLDNFLKQKSGWSSFREWIYYTNGEAHLIGSTNPPRVFPDIAVTPGLPGEFADYFEGAIAYYQGDGDTAEAAWERLLKLPAAERKFKSTWAAYMLGTAWDSEGHDASAANAADDERALKYFLRVNELAQNGFDDSLGLNTASIGREARIWLRRKNYEGAIELYLQQMAAGDDSAMISLRFTTAAALDENGATLEQMKLLAKNPRTRRVITAYLISRNPYSDRSEITGNADAKKFFGRTDRWLAAVESAKVKDLESAEQLALAAYQAGDMDAAQRWVNRAGDSPVAEWLQAKLFLRAGKIDAAAKLLAKVSREFPQELPGTNAPKNFAESLFVDIEPVWHEPIAVGQQSLGELGVLHLARREYAEALDALLRSGYWMDAAYVAERVLTTDELKTYVDRNWPALADGESETEIMTDGGYQYDPFIPREKIRWLLARRIARENGGANALIYFSKNYSGDYETLLGELRDGRDEKLPAEIRAKNLFAAAVMTRTDGIELFGTELEPDWEIVGGNYDFGVGCLEYRATNSLQVKINLAGTNEIERASSRLTIPDKRFHYRWQAAALAWEAAQLMPDNSDETARVLCTGGTWIKDRDLPAADKFYKALVRRCRKTAIGNQADKMRWFPVLDENGNPKPYKPRLETIEITPELTNTVATNYLGEIFGEYPVPGRKYHIHTGDDLREIALAVRRLGRPMTAKDILLANPGLDPAQMEVGQFIMIPETTALTNSPSM